MFAASLLCLRSAAERSTRFPSLRRRLQHLRHTNRVAKDELKERRRLQKLLRGTKTHTNTAGFTVESSKGNNIDEATNRAIRLLPRNDALEAAMALSISENRDARTELEFVRQLINSTLLSLASPVDLKWDPYDVKPQVFALNTYIALPVFTSIQYLRLFCQRFGFSVRDPSGVLWAAGASNASEDVLIAGLLPDAVIQSAWWHHRHAQSVQETTAKMEENSRAQQPHQKTEESGGNEAVTTFAAGASLTYKDEIIKSTAVKTEPSQCEGQSMGDVVFSAPPTASSSEAFMDASLLFDLMTMEGVAVETTAAVTPATGSSKNKKKIKSKLSRRTSFAKKRITDATQRKLKNKQRNRRHRLTKRGGRQQRRKVSASNTQSAAPNGETDAQKENAKEEDAMKSAYWQAVAQTAPFELKQASPLPTFGPFLYPFLLGYFADISTLLHNAAIVPEKVDIIVNPGSPIELVLARAATDRVLHKEQLLHLAYLKVEKELQREFSNFFEQHCPEVLYASSACVPVPMERGAVEGARRASRNAVNGPPGATDASASNPLQEYRERTRLLREAEYRNGVAYELAILIQSTALEETFQKMQKAKHQSMLMGHADLDVLPEAAAAPHVREVAQLFYDGVSEQEKRTTQQAVASHAAEMRKALLREGDSSAFSEKSPSSTSPRKSNIGVFVRRGTPQTINVAQSADSYYHDPTNAYTEAHAVFTEELKVKRGQ